MECAHWTVCGGTRVVWEVEQVLIYSFSHRLRDHSRNAVSPASNSWPHGRRTVSKEISGFSRPGQIQELELPKAGYASIDCGLNSCAFISFSEMGLYRLNCCLKLQRSWRKMLKTIQIWSCCRRVMSLSCHQSPWFTKLKHVLSYPDSSTSIPLMILAIG